jgi:saccharopine dehydrogenase-like NADP-dependent oxidoreductase
MTYDFVVFGATGQQGRIVSKDLLYNGYSVLLCGRDQGKISHLLKDFKKSKFQYVDLREKNNVVETMKNSGASTSVNCAEGDYNLSTMEAAYDAGLHYLDLGSDEPMTVDQFALHDKFKAKGLTAITGCGSTPGVVNVMARHVAEQFDTIHTLDVGFAWNSNMPVFIVPFSVESITEEFTEQANMLEDGKFTHRPARSNDREFDYMEIGKQRTYYTRHPEPITFHHYYSPKGLKNARVYSSFPDHSRNVLEMFISLGLDSEIPIKVDDAEVRPVKVLTQVLKRIQMPDGYLEKEDLWMHMLGTKNGKPHEIKMDCIAATLKGWEDATCNVDTGMPCSIMAQFVKNGVASERGVFGPEAIIPPKPFFAELAKRQMRVYLNGEKIN